MNLAFASAVFAGGPGSGCRGTSCGRKKVGVVYHGTPAKNVPKIKKEGLRRNTYGASNKQMAIDYAVGKIAGYPMVGRRFAIVVIKNAERAGFGKMDSTTFARGRGRAVYSPNPVAPENIKRVELYEITKWDEDAFDYKRVR